MTEPNDIPLGFLPCRSLLHAWEIDTFTRANEEELRRFEKRQRYSQYIARNSICMRCGTTRIELFGRNHPQKLTPFNKIATRYQYPQGYLYHGDDRPTRATYTTALFERYYQGRRNR